MKDNTNKYTRFYAAVTIEENNKYFAYVVPFTDADNALYKLNEKGIIFANVFPTKKRAAAVADAWNESYKNNGTYLFGEGRYFENA